MNDNPAPIDQMARAAAGGAPRLSPGGERDAAVPLARRESGGDGSEMGAENAMRRRRKGRGKKERRRKGG